MGGASSSSSYLYGDQWRPRLNVRTDMRPPPGSSIERGAQAAAQPTHARRTYSCCSRLIQSGMCTAPGPRIDGSRWTPNRGSVI